MGIIFRRTQGDTGPAITARLTVDGTYFPLAGASVLLRVAGTVGSGPGAIYNSFQLPATWGASPGGSVMVGLNPSGLGGPCASAAQLWAQFWAAASGGAVYQWPEDGPAPFIVVRRV